jgi:hypothetical protein
MNDDYLFINIYTWKNFSPNRRFNFQILQKNNKI